MSDRSPADPDDSRTTGREARRREPRTDEARASGAPPDGADPQEPRQDSGAEYDGPLPVGEVPPWKLPEEEWPDPEDEAADLHPALDVVADASVYLAVGSVALAFAGLAALGLDYSIPGRTMIAVGIGGATVALLLASIVGALTKGRTIALRGPDT